MAIPSSVSSYVSQNPQLFAGIGNNTYRGGIKPVGQQNTQIGQFNVDGQDYFFSPSSWGAGGGGATLSPELAAQLGGSAVDYGGKTGYLFDQNPGNALQPGQGGINYQPGSGGSFGGLGMDRGQWAALAAALSGGIGGALYGGAGLGASGIGAEGAVGGLGGLELPAGMAASGAGSLAGPGAAGTIGAAGGGLAAEEGAAGLLGAMGGPGAGLEIPGGMAASGAGPAAQFGGAVGGAGAGSNNNGMLSFLKGSSNGVMGSGLSPLQLGLGLGSTAYGLYAGQQLKNQGAELSKSSDPFGAYRPAYGNQLLQFMSNPSSIEDDPAYQQSVQATRRAMAKGGYTMSGNEMEALKQNYGNFYDQHIARLAGLAGAGIGPNPNPAMLGSTSAAQLTGNSLANLGLMAALGQR